MALIVEASNSRLTIPARVFEQTQRLDVTIIP